MDKQQIQCSICGKSWNKDEEGLQVEHIFPVSNSKGNLIPICAECHRDLDSRQFTEIEFNNYIASLMKESGNFSDVKLEERISGEKPFRADITATDKQGKKWLVECKRSSSFTPAGFHKAYHQIKKYKELSSFDQYVLAFPGLASDNQKYRLVSEDISVWDAGAIAEKFKQQISDSKHPIFSSLFLSQAEKDKQSPEMVLLEKLKKCEKGREAWSDYQKLIGQILEQLFCPLLEAPISESPDLNNVNRRDWIMPNYSDQGFWHFIREKYSADYVVVDAKNYKNPISKEQVLQIANYLKPHGAGMFAIITTRIGSNKSADLTIREQWMANGKMILVLNDEDIEAMLLAKSAGGKPEKVIGQLIERFRLSM